LYLYPAAFPYGIDLPAESLGAVLTSRMVHFLTPEQVEAGFKKIHRWLKPGGKLFFTSVSPYHDAFRERFAPTYEQNLKEGKEWPGVIENQWEINPKHKEYVEPYLNVFDVPQLEKLLPKYGFEIDSIKLFDYPNDTESRNLGHIGFIATKL
jgi:SAM-dependent methyltransferase